MLQKVDQVKPCTKQNVLIHTSWEQEGTKNIWRFSDRESNANSLIQSLLVAVNCTVLLTVLRDLEPSSTRFLHSSRAYSNVCEGILFKHDTDKHLSGVSYRRSISNCDFSRNLAAIDDSHEVTNGSMCYFYTTFEMFFHVTCETNISWFSKMRCTNSTGRTLVAKQGNKEITNSAIWLIV